MLKVAKTPQVFEIEQQTIKNNIQESENARIESEIKLSNIELTMANIETEIPVGTGYVADGDPLHVTLITGQQADCLSSVVQKYTIDQHIGNGGNSVPFIGADVHKVITTAPPHIADGQKPTWAEEMETILPGVFAIGDVRQKKLRQVTTAVGDGGAVMHAVEEYLRD